MAGPGCRLLRLAGVTVAATANWAALTAAAQSSTTLTPDRITDTERAPYSSRLAAVLAPCLVGLAVLVMLGLALAAAKLQERRQTEGGFGPRQLEGSGGRSPPAELGNTSIRTLAERVERLV
ncbi:protein crumbs homolog 3-like [Brachionichthys hirsutus]|uniref:protein crumbs homolog 3-like n=1 Tax=Brachionichthys hirsutus TaxID=412623 RepID=UPI003604D32F